MDTHERGSNLFQQYFPKCRTFSLNCGSISTQAMDTNGDTKFKTAKLKMSQFFPYFWDHVPGFGLTLRPQTALVGG